MSELSEEVPQDLVLIKAEKLLAIKIKRRKIVKLLKDSDEN